MAVRTVSVEEARELLAQGYTYLDVRSEPEFEQGHVPGAVNVPLLHAGANGMQPNPDFTRVAQAAFDAGHKLVVGCRAGGRSARAAQMLEAAGFENLCDMPAGFVAGKDAFGRPLPGWSQKGLPVETGAGTGEAYADVKQRVKG